MWTVLTYVYNSILIIFIATHLIVGALISFLVGLYIGVYLCQNYEIPKINEPSKLWAKMAIFIEQYRKKPSSSKLDLLRATTMLSLIKADDDDDQEGLTSPEALPTSTLILTDPDFSDFRREGRPSSQILEASLIISQD